MKLTKERRRDFVLELMDLSARMFHKLSTNREKGRQQFLTWVYEKKLTGDPEELFFLGGLAERYYHGVLADEDDREWLRNV
jgi:hypothetical protein